MTANPAIGTHALTTTGCPRQVTKKRISYASADANAVTFATPAPSCAVPGPALDSTGIRGHGVIVIAGSSPLRNLLSAHRPLWTHPQLRPGRTLTGDGQRRAPPTSPDRSDGHGAPDARKQQPIADSGCQRAAPVASGRGVKVPLVLGRCCTTGPPARGHPVPEGSAADRWTSSPPTRRWLRSNPTRDAAVEPGPAKPSPRSPPFTVKCPGSSRTVAIGRSPGAFGS